jgi:hypothetical protein
MKPALLQADQWQTLQQQATILVKSGMLPSSIKTPEQAITIAIKAHELGIPMMQGFAGINIIQGRPTISPELMLALIYQRVQGAYIHFVKLGDDECIIEAARPNGPRHTFKFTMDDAKRAQLDQKDNWRKWPRAMLRSRTVSEMARTIFPDAVAGCSYTPDEINPDITINQDGGFVAIPQSSNGFDAHNDSHVNHLYKLLEKQEVPRGYWGRIGELMQGKSSKDIELCITTAREEFDKDIRENVFPANEVIDV